MSILSSKWVPRVYRAHPVDLRTRRFPSCNICVTWLDDAEHKISGYEVKSIEIDGEPPDLYGMDDFIFTGSEDDFTVVGTDADTHRMGLAADKPQNTDPNFTDVEFIIEGSTLIIEENTPAAPPTNRPNRLPAIPPPHCPRPAIAPDSSP